MSRIHFTAGRLLRILTVTIVVTAFVYFLVQTTQSYLAAFRNYLSTNNIDFTKYDNVTGFDYPIVPNVVHFFRFRNHTFTFTDMVSIAAAWCHQRPDRLIIHCDCDEFEGPYWDKIQDLAGLEVHRMKEPRAVYGRPLSSVYHGGDVARLAVLMKYGGIALDLDTYVVRSLDEFRRFEMTLGWPLGESIGTQALIAHKNARFLKKWLDSYKFYRPNEWYYNAGQLPTHILEKEPHLVHRVPELLGIHNLIKSLYKTWLWNEWQKFYTIHLLIRHRSYMDEYSKIANFDEENIKYYPYVYGEMARLVVYGTKSLDPNDINNNWTISQCRSEFT